jgi:hypothetical protein
MLKPLLRLSLQPPTAFHRCISHMERSESPPREAWREFYCGVLWLRYRLPMTQECLSNVLTAALVVVAALWLWFLLAYAEWIFRHFVPGSP